jgi:hypothetical protein
MMRQSMVALVLTAVAASASPQVECFFNKDGQVLCNSAINMHHGQMGETHNNTAVVTLKGSGGDGHNHAINMHHGLKGETHNNTDIVNLKGSGGGSATGGDGHNHVINMHHGKEG